MQFQKDYGLSIAPAHRGRKTPTPWNGYHSATNDPDVLLDLWRGDHGKNYLVATDSIKFPPGLVVIDIDIATESKPDKADGNLSWAKLIAAHEAEVPDTLTVRSRSGGVQYWFAPAPGVHHARKINFLPSLDILAGAGYVMGPGSQHDGWKIDRKSGELVPDLPAGDWTIISQTREIALLPPFLSDLLPKVGVAYDTPAKGSGQPPKPRAVRLPPPPPKGPRKEVSLGYVHVAINAELELMRNAEPLTRTPNLFRIATAFGHIGAVPGMRNHLSMSALADALMDAAIASGLDEGDSYRHIERGIEAGLKSPRNWKLAP